MNKVGGYSSPVAQVLVHIVLDSLLKIRGFLGFVSSQSCTVWATLGFGSVGAVGPTPGKY